MKGDEVSIGNKLGRVKSMQKDVTRTTERVMFAGVQAVVYKDPVDTKIIIRGDSFWEVLPLQENKIESPQEEEPELVDELPADTGIVSVEAVKLDVSDLTGKDHIARAATMAVELTRVIDKCKLFSMIQGKKYVHVEGWQTLGAMVGCKAIIAKIKEEGDYIEATADIRNMNGDHLGCGISRCYCDEVLKTREGKIIKRWTDAEGNINKQAVLSMAQTRAIGKAYRNNFAWIIRLAGYEPTPMEEMK